MKGKSKVFLPLEDSVHFVQEPLQLRPSDKYLGLTYMQVLNSISKTNIFSNQKEVEILSTKRMGVLLFHIPAVPPILHAPEGSCVSSESHLP